MHRSDVAHGPVRTGVAHHNLAGANTAGLITRFGFDVSTVTRSTRPDSNSRASEATLVMEARVFVQIVPASQASMLYRQSEMSTV